MQNENTHESKLYFTSDGLAFFDEQNALNHAVRLEDPSIKTRTKAEVDAEADLLLAQQWESGLDYDLIDDLDAE